MSLLFKFNVIRFLRFKRGVISLMWLPERFKVTNSVRFEIKFKSVKSHSNIERCFRFLH